jgi:iron complex transport system substrate-binding protein
MRIVSLAPAATEMLFALGLGPDLIAVTHQCDYPAAARELPKVTRPSRSDRPGAAAVDAAARERTLAGGPLYELDPEALAAFEPDLIVTPARCATCAITSEEVRALAEELDTQPLVVALDPHTVGEVLGGARTLAQATDTKDEAVDLIREASDRIDRVRLLVRRAGHRPRVLALQWLDPPCVAGEWTPQLIEYAGGEDVLGFAGEQAEQTSWEEAAAASPDIVLVMPRGLDAEIAFRESEMHRDQLAALGAGEIIALDAAYFTRPGPRIVDGLELLASIIHPELVEDNPEHSGRALTGELY